jgi:hypothetical protein
MGATPDDAAPDGMTLATLATLAAEAERYRATAARWDELGERRPRSRTLVALQYDRRADDAPLLRHLLAHEIRARHDGDREGDGVNWLDLAAFLLARFRDPADLALFARAKLADFDAYCGFDREYLFAAGLDAARAQLAHLPPELRDEIAAIMIDDPDDLTTWWADKEAWYPVRWEDEPSDVLVELAIAWDDRPWASTLLDAAERTTPRDAAFLERLASSRRAIGEPLAAVAALREAAALTVDPFDRARQAQKLCAALLEAGRPEDAALAFADAAALAAAIPAVHRIGLGRNLVEQGFTIAEALPVGDAARALVHTVATLSMQLTSRSLELLQHAVAAARRHGLDDLAAQYAVDAEAERRRIEGELDG